MSPQAVKAVAVIPPAASMAHQCPARSALPQITAMCRPRSFSAQPGRLRAASACGRGSRRVNTEPLPSRLCADTCPPISSTRSRTMASPSPEPP